MSHGYFDVSEFRDGVKIMFDDVPTEDAWEAFQSIQLPVIWIEAFNKKEHPIGIDFINKLMLSVRHVERVYLNRFKVKGSELKIMNECKCLALDKCIFQSIEFSHPQLLEHLEVEGDFKCWGDIPWESVLFVEFRKVDVDLVPWERLVNLEAALFSGMNLAVPLDFRHMKKFRGLSIQFCNRSVVQLPIFAPEANLEWLLFYQTKQVSSLKSVSHCTALRYLDTDSTEIMDKDFSTIGNFSKLPSITLPEVHRQDLAEIAKYRPANVRVYIGKDREAALR